MHTNGQIVTTHKSGRIVYKGQGEIRADGSNQADVENWRAKVVLEEAAGKQNGFEDEEDAAMEALLNQAASGDFVDDFDLLNPVEPSSHPYTYSQAGTEPNPPNFSKVDLSQGYEYVYKKYPNLPQAVDVTVKKGQMLFLPAGWFHEVRSSGGLHMALNYWFHPPDNLHSDTRGFFQPYCLSYWGDIWASQLGQVQKARVAVAEESPTHTVLCDSKGKDTDVSKNDLKEAQKLQELLYTQEMELMKEMFIQQRDKEMAMKRRLLNRIRGFKARLKMRRARKTIGLKNYWSNFVLSH